MRTKQTKGFAAACVALVVFTAVLPACAPPAPEPPPKTGGSAVKVATWLLEKAGGVAASKGFGFVFSAIGLNTLFPDGNTQQLEDIKRQLDAKSLQLNQVQQSLNTLTGDLAQSELTTQLNALRDQSAKVKTLFDEYFKPMLASASAHQTAKASGDRQRIDTTFAALIRDRDDFYKQYDTLGASTLAGDISRRLTPGDATSALAAKGRALMTKNGGRRYLTADDSAQIRAMYDNFAEYEALAAWMRMERWIPSDPAPPAGTKPGNLANYENARTEYLDQTQREHAGLPPVIPTDTVIDTGTGASTTNGATMWRPVASSARYRPGNRDAGSVPVLLDALNADVNRSYADWRIPTAANLSSLLSGFKAASGATPNKFLAGLNPSSPSWTTIADGTPWPYVWSQDVVTFSGTCTTRASNPPLRTYKVQLQTAVVTTGANPAWGGRPAMPSTAYDTSGRSGFPNCDPVVEATFAGPNALGGFLALRTVDTSPIDFMAQGTGPYLRPNADLRFADLTNLYLAGFDLTGSDLRGARIVGTDLTGADLSGVQLAGVTSSNIIGVPAKLPAGWALVNGRLVGPGTILTGADLSGGDLSAVNLTGVRSGGVDCTGCVLPSGAVWTGLPSGYLVGRFADLTGADLTGVDLRGVDLSLINFAGADLTNADLAGTDLTGTNFTLALLTGADLTGARFLATNLTGAALSGATLSGAQSNSVVGVPSSLPTAWRLVNKYLVGPGASLLGADLRGANLRDADLSGADLTLVSLVNADLTNATLTNVILSGADISGARFATDNDNKLAGIESGGLVGAPAQLPVSVRFRIVEGYFVGPSANLTEARFTSGAQLGISLSATNFTRANLTGLNLSGAFMNNANLTNAVLTGTNLTGVNLSAATLTGVRSGGIIGTPALPAGWSVVGGFLVGPGAVPPA